MAAPIPAPNAALYRDGCFALLKTAAGESSFVQASTRLLESRATSFLVASTDVRLASLLLSISRVFHVELPVNYLRTKLQDLLVSMVKRVESGVLGFNMAARKIHLMVKDVAGDRITALEVMRPFDNLYAQFNFEWFGSGAPPLNPSTPICRNDRFPVGRARVLRCSRTS